MKYADIIVDISAPNLDKSFTYEIPDELGELSIGTPVMIPFGAGNKQKKGYVCGIRSTRPEGNFKLKKIEGIVKNSLTIEDEFMALAYKMKTNYGGMLKDSLRTVIPVKQKVDLKKGAARKDAFPEITELIKNYPDGLKNGTELNEEQKLARDTVCADIDEGIHKTYLLHGVTGSGKTEVYIEIIRHVIEKGMQVIVLIPEISLTYQTVKRFALCFGNKVAFSHSKLSKGERYEQSEKARNGEISIMIGPRSALFTPFGRLGLIIIDEEHEASYKSENTPKYHAREVAIWRAEMAGASVLLGSATPSLESYSKACNGEYTLLRLSKRAMNAEMPKSHIIDMRAELKSGNRSIFSKLLLEKIKDRLGKKEQTMLFLNRRGYAGFVSCRSCGYVPKCPHCDISLTLHANKRLYCHYCGYSIDDYKKCPSCGSGFIGGFGTGTEKIEKMIGETFPEARVLRMDADTTSKKGDFEKILSAFSKKKADILIGTQMIVKGHDFPDVSLVGILAADLSLFAGDYRAAERTYQLLSQASGRAGRSRLPGEVVIQTYNPEHYCVEYAAENRYADFYNQEIAARRMMGYPPAGNMMVIYIQSESPLKNSNVAEKLIYCIKHYEISRNYKYRVLGPSEAAVKKLKDLYRSVIYVKDSDYEKLVSLKDAIEYFINSQKISEASVQFDFNPVKGY